MKEGILIYGCYGYTGQLISEHAVASGLKPVLAGRDAKKVLALANKLSLPSLVFDLTDAKVVADKLRDFKVVIHCAGPFKYTSRVMVKACLLAKTHYLDITGEYEIFENIFRLNQEAKDAGILLMPGVGFDVVPTDCLALHLKTRLPAADTLEMALFQKGGKLSHGTAITITESIGEGCVIREKGKLVTIPAGSLTKVIDFGEVKRTAVAIPWGDISSAFRTTKIPNITIYNVAAPSVIDSMKLSNYLGFFFRSSLVKRFLINRIKKRPAGPSEEIREKAQTLIWGEVKNPFGVSKSTLLELPEGYTLTAWTAVKIAQNILTQEPPSGSHTPAEVYGKDFILQFDKVKRRDIE